MQKAIHIQNPLRVTQGPNTTGSHKASEAVDFGGRYDGSRGNVDGANAPFDAVVARIRTGANGECYIHNTAPVLCADGKVRDKLTVMLIHTTKFEVKQGQTLKQGQHYYTEGGMGAGNPSKYQPHIHAEVCAGHVTNQVQNASGTWVLPNQLKWTDVFYLPKSFEVIKNGGLPWVVLDDTGEVTDAGNTTAPAGEATQASAEKRLRIYAMNRAQENPADINAYVLEQKEKREQVTLSVTAGGDGKRRAGHSRSPAREYTPENRNDVLAQQVAEMGLDEALVQCDGEKTRLWQLEPVGETHTEAIAAACACADPVVLRSPNAAGTGDSQWYLGRPIRAVEGTSTAQVATLLAYLDDPDNKLLPGNYLIGG